MIPFFRIIQLFFKTLFPTFIMITLIFNSNTMLVFNLKEVMKARQIERPYSFLVKAGISPHSANNLLHSESRVFRLDHIEKLCEILHCEPNDLVAFKPNATQKLQQNHPLNKFLAKEDTFDWQQTLKTMPIAQLKEVSKLINQAKENKEE